jgi:hypothetical protein
LRVPVILFLIMLVMLILAVALYVPSDLVSGDDPR